jgi:hypothetical protein
MILDAATIFVLALVAIYFGSFAWIEIRARRAQNKARTPEQNSGQDISNS